MEENTKPLASVYEFTNERDAKTFARAQHGPVNIEIERVARGRWFVDISSK